MEHAASRISLCGASPRDARGSYPDLSGPAPMSQRSRKRAAGLLAVAIRSRPEPPTELSVSFKIHYKALNDFVSE